MRTFTKAEQIFCMEYEKHRQSLSPEVVCGINVLLSSDSFVCHARTKLAIVIVPRGTDICEAIRQLSLNNYYVIPFTEEEVVSDVSKAVCAAYVGLFPLIGDMEDYGLYCIDNAEKMEEVLRGAWTGWVK